MADILCILMGVVDIIAGALIIIGFGTSWLGIAFGLMIFAKGAMSFIG